MKPTVKVKPVAANFSTVIRKNGAETEVNREETVDYVETTSKMMLDVELGLTKNLKRFESARITIRVSRPTSEKTLEEDYETTRNWIEGKIADEVASVNQSMQQSAIDSADD